MKRAQELISALVHFACRPEEEYYHSNRNWTLEVEMRFRVLALFLIAGAAAMAQTAGKVSFSRDVAPVLAQKCMQCHSQAPAMANLDLRSRESALKGGQNGPAIVPGNAAASHLYRRLTGQEQPQMPLGGRLTHAESKAFTDFAAWPGASVHNVALAFANVPSGFGLPCAVSQ